MDSTNQQCGVEASFISTSSIVGTQVASPPAPVIASRHAVDGRPPALIKDRSSELLMYASRTEEERVAALRLVQKNYCQAGLASESPDDMRVLPHHLVNSTQILVAKRFRQIAFTVSLVGNGRYGVPSDSLFSEEIREMESSGLRLAEVSCVASNSRLLDSSERTNTLISMIGLTIHTARARGVDRLLLAVHPRHARIYRRMFGCVPCSEVKSYDAVLGNPAVLCVHDFRKLDEEKYSLYDRIYGMTFNDWQLSGIGMSPEEQTDLSRHIDDQCVGCVPIAA